MKHNRKKSGFTLVELMVFFVFISLVLAASAPIITKRVKYIPERVGHGKFMCYNNGHTQVYYNATKLISTESVSKCEFKPPKKNALFKVELIGGGAGGVNSDPYPVSDVETRSGGYSLPGGPYGDRSINPTGAQLLSVFGLEGAGGADFTFVEATDSAEDGESVSMSITGTGDPQISINYDACFTSQRYWDEDYEYEVEVCDEDADGNCIYDCTPKLDSDGNPILDSDGNPEETCVERTHKETRYGRWDWTENGVQEPWKPECSDWETQANNLTDSIRAASESITSDTWWYQVANEAIVAGYRASAQAIGGPENTDLTSFATALSPRGEGELGGNASYLVVKGKVDFCDYKQHPGGCGGNCTTLTGTRPSACVPVDGVDAYLQQLFGSSIVAGTTKGQGTECIGWGYQALNKHDGTYNSDEKNKIIMNTRDPNGNYQGTWGYDVLHYNAIKTWDKCATNTKRAIGGQGGWYNYVYGDSLAGNFRAAIQRDAEELDSDGITGYPFPNYSYSDEYETKKIPSMKISTTLSTRTHKEVGNGGGAGDYRTYYISNLDDDCIFNIASGGSSISPTTTTGTIAALEAGLETSMTCNSNTLRLHASGGNYNPGVFEREYNGFDYVDLSTGIADVPDTYKTSDGGSSSLYQPNDIYTKYAITASGFGAGGGGAYIVDGCTMVTGSYWHQLVYGSSAAGNKHNYNVHSTKTSCNPETDIRTYGASSGSGGAVIITW